MIPGPVRVSCPCCAAQRGETVNIQDHYIGATSALEHLAMMLFMRDRARELKGELRRPCASRSAS